MTRRLLVALLLAVSVHAQPAPLPADERKALVEIAAHLFDEIYVIPDRGATVAAALREKLAAGGYDDAKTAADLAKALGTDIRRLGDDKHLYVGYEEKNAANPILTKEAFDAQRAERRGPMMGPGPDSEEQRRMNYGLVRAERLEGNVGYLEIAGFSAGPGMREAIAAAMGFIANTDSVIVDVRQCPGGSGDGVAFLASYFFDAEPRVLMTRHFRDAERSMQSTTVGDLPGKRMDKADLYILTSGRSGSACESFAYTLQQWGRAKVVGEVTSGAGHNNTFVNLGRGLRMSISIGRPVHPKSGKGWEGEGVQPDLAVPAANALEVAHREALKTLLPRAKNDAARKEIESATTADLAADEVKKVERAWLDAYEQRDPVAMERIVADNFLIVHADGSTQTKADILKMLERGRAANRPSAKFTTEDVSVRVFGDTAIVNGKVKMQMGDKTSVDRYSDTYVRLGGRWQVVSSALATP